nr:MAG: replication associated protein [Cressdnaviricota sp.]
MDQPVTNVPVTSTAPMFRAATLTHYGEDWTALPNNVSYLAWADEVCPTTQRPHKQAWAYSQKPQRLTGWKKSFPGDHIEQMRGTFAQNDTYCSKTTAGVLKELGERPMDNGKKRSLATLCDVVAEAAKTATPLYAALPQDLLPTYAQYHSGVKEVFNLCITKRLKSIPADTAPDVIYIWGPPGSGKTRLAMTLDPELYRIPPSDKYKWKSGNYCGQPAVLYDNVDETNIDPPTLLQEIDRYYSDVPTKGGFVGWRPLRIYITSCISPDELSRRAKFLHPREFTRRLTRVEYLSGALPE